MQSVVDEVKIWVSFHCTCRTGDRCNCPSGRWIIEERSYILRLWFDYGVPAIGFQPKYSRGYPVPEKVPRTSIFHSSHKPTARKEHMNDKIISAILLLVEAMVKPVIEKRKTKKRKSKKKAKSKKKVK